MSDKITRIAFGVFTTYERTGWVHPTQCQFFEDLRFRSDIAYRRIPVHNFVPAAAGRNQLCKQLKDSEADWICMIDNDMEIKDNFMDAIKDAPEDAAIICPAFYMWNQGKLELTLCWGMEEAPDGIASFSPGFHEITKCGTGAIFIKPQVFQKLEYPYFKYIWNEDCGQAGTEDIVFCNAARKAGFKIYGNGGVKVGHYKSVEIGQMWDWHNKISELQEAAAKKLLDRQNGTGVFSRKKDSGRSPEQNASDSVPAEAISAH